MAPTKCAKRAAEEALEEPTDLEIKPTTPFGMGLSFIRTAVSSLTTSFGTSLPFISEYSVKNLKLYDEIKRNQATKEQLETSTVPPRSMRFNFELKTSAEFAKHDKFVELADSVQAPITACQQALKSTVIASATLKLDLLKQKKMEHCIQFICYLVQAYIIAKPEFKVVHPIRAVDRAVGHVSLATLFLTLTEDESRKVMCKFFLEDPATAFENDDDLNAVTTALANILVKDTHQLFVVPENKYEEQNHYVSAIKQLQALSTTAVKGPATEAAALQMDLQATIPDKDLDALIDRKVQAKTKELQQAIKNLSRGATSNASSKTKSDANTTSSGNPSGGRTFKRRNNNQKALNPSLKATQRYSSAKKEKETEEADAANSATKRRSGVKWNTLAKKKKTNAPPKSNKPTKQQKKK